MECVKESKINECQKIKDIIILTQHLNHLDIDCIFKSNLYNKII